MKTIFLVGIGFRFGVSTVNKNISQMQNSLVTHWKWPLIETIFF